MHMIAHRSGDTDTTGRTFGLKPRCHIHCVAVKVSAIGDRVANVDPDAEPDGSFRGLVAVMDRNLLLHLHSATHRPIDAIKHDEQRVAAGLDDPAAMLIDRRVYQVARSARRRSSVPTSSKPIRRLYPTMSA